MKIIQWLYLNRHIKRRKGFYLGHADESTTLRYYIYDTDTQDENNKKVLNALENGGESTKFNEYDSTNVRQREIKIIPFHKKEKAENPIKYKAFHS